jgi:hypothetical protein
MALNWNEIKKRAIAFSKEWEDVSREKAEAQTFWNDFFNIFGITRRRIASFEEPVKKLDEKYGFIDLFWKGTLIVEHKSVGKDLDKAYTQAIEYFPGIKEEELPKYVLVSDFKRFRLYNLEENTTHQFNLIELYKNINLFDFILGVKKQKYKEEDPVNIEAAELMGKLHDALKENGYSGHKLEIFLVRILFCMFADDTGIFQKGHFEYFIKERTRVDGLDLGPQISQIFEILNTPENTRQKNIDEDINAFPYVNGKLYEENLSTSSFDSGMRNILMQCCCFDWSKISPAIFGSLFQSVMDQEKRRDLGAHYTSEKNIMKVIKGLFLDELHNEFEECKSNQNKLEKFLDKISNLKFLDPACGCGNFLIIAYRELRLLEIKILKELFRYHRREILEDGTAGDVLQREVQMRLEAKEFSRIDVDCMYGIEIEEFPARIAEVAMYLIDHQMNLILSETFGSYYRRLPLKKAPNIHNQNALKINWNDVIPNNQCNYILGNPPFVGKKRRSTEQNEDMDRIFTEVNNYGVLDYVCSWYIKATEYINSLKIKVAFVSTNSISQGEQVGILWSYLISKNIKIHFAHRTFKWDNEAKGKAAVHVVIIGFANYDSSLKYLYDYETVKSNPTEIKASNINPYLVDQSDLLILSRNKPICNVPEIIFGNMPNDDGNFLFTDEEKNDFLKIEPESKKFIKPLVSGKEFLHGEKRWCLWLENIKPSEIINLPEVEKRVENVKLYRLKSTREATKKLAQYPYLFGEIRQPKQNYVLIPRVSSENRRFIPLAFLSPNFIVGDTCVCIPKATKYLFGILTSSMHMAWVRQVCGRLKSDYRYSNNLVYNNYPFPDNPSKEKVLRVEEEVRNLLNVRTEYKNESLADLYDPIAMPKKLVDAHNRLDKAVDLCYRPQPFPTELSRLEFLFDLYKKYTNPIFAEPKKKRRKS